MVQSNNQSGEKDPVLGTDRLSSECNQDSKTQFLWGIDKKLEKAIRRSINLLNYNQIISEKQLQETKELNLAKADVSDLTGIEKFTNLVSLDVTSNPLNNEQLQHLQSLTNLKVLKLDNNNLSDLSAIANLTKLKELSLNNNQIENISILANLTELESLLLNYNSVSVIEVLSQLTNLKAIYLDGNKISGLQALGNLTNLEILSANYNQIISLDDFIHNLLSLRYLSLSHNQIKAEKICPLVKLRELRQLHLDNNQIKDIRFLGVLSQLEVLTINNNPIDDWEPLNHLNQLKPVYRQLWETKLPLEMMYLPGGKFLMGSTKNSNESPQHEVTVLPFLLGKYQVTQAEYQAIMHCNPSYSKGENFPVENVSWDNAVEFCARLSEETGLNFRLPSEAEWEYACRGTTNTEYYCGDNLNTRQANYNTNKTIEVGKYPPNRFGLYDMYGNVWEWCSDDWHDNYEGAPDDGSVWSNNSEEKVIRGGCFYMNETYCRSASRNSNARGARHFDIGFRVALVLSTDTVTEVETETDNLTG